MLATTPSRLMADALFELRFLPAHDLGRELGRDVLQKKIDPPDQARDLIARLRDRFADFGSQREGQRAGARAASSPRNLRSTATALRRGAERPRRVAPARLAAALARHGCFRYLPRPLPWVWSVAGSMMRIARRLAPAAATR